MWSVREALEKFIQSLELTPGQREDVSRQHTQVRECLRQRLGTTDFLSGSYSRNTAIRPLHDIDVFVVLGESPSAASSVTAPGGVTADAALKRVRQALHEQWPNKELSILQQHSVHLGFTKTGLEFDVVPAYKVSGRDAYLIPERDTGRWVPSNPSIHQKLSTEANERAGKKLKPLLKVVKHWKRLHKTLPVRSFHLEVLSYGAFSCAPGDYLEGLEQLFTSLSQRVVGPCLEPAGLGPPVDTGVKASQKEAAQRELASAARQVRLARAESTADPEGAHGRLRELFGDFYRQG